MAPVVITESLTHAYNSEVVALRDFNLAIEPGVTGLVGANGAGKTTFLRILLGLIHPTSGRVSVLGHDAIGDPLAVRARVGYMPENNCLPKDQTAADFVAYAAEMAGLPTSDARRRASETLFLVGLEEERFRFLGDFSTGMAQRVKLAQSIVHGPELVLLDEPASGLDPAGREQMLEIIRRLGSFGINVIFSSHLLGDIEQTCDSVVMIDGGHLIRSGPVTRASLTSVVVLDVLGHAEVLADRLNAGGIEASVLTDQRLSFTIGSEGDYDLVRDAAADLGIGIFRMAPITHTLEDEFLVIARLAES